MIERPALSIVLPFFNEGEIIPTTLLRLNEFKALAPFSVEVIAVNDGSRDNTASLLDEAAQQDPLFKVIHLSRNFGHQIALTAGLDYAEGERVAVMDGDLQDPLPVLLTMIRELDSGYDIVLGRRGQRKGESHFKIITARLFYWVMQKLTRQQLPENVGDFRLMNRKSLLALRQMRELHRFLRGMVAWVGFRQKIIEYDRQERLAGTTKYSLRRMLSFAWNAITSFSALPLYLISALGLLIVAFGLCYSAYSAYEALVLKVTVPGWASLVILQCLFSGLTLLSVGVVGLYVGKVFEEAKGRPLYFIQSTKNFSDS